MSELALWHLDQRINDRGLPVDVKLLHTALELTETLTDQLNAQIARLTNGAVERGTQRDKLLAYLRSRDVPIETMRAEEVEFFADLTTEPNAREILTHRLELARASTKKLKSMLDSQVDGRVYDTLQFAGASRTGRWAGRRIQPQNFIRPLFERETVLSLIDAIERSDTDELSALSSDRPMSAIASCLRGMIAAPPGKKLVVGDYSQIEARTLPWLANDEEALDVFRSGRDPYVVAAAGIYKVDEGDVTKSQRFVGKVAELSLGYQGSVGALAQMAANYGAVIPEDERPDIVSGWRESRPVTRSMWYEVERAARNAIDHPGQTFKARRLSFRCKASPHCGTPRLWMALPSGRALCYHNARIKRMRVKNTDPKTGKEVTRMRDVICYQGTHEGRWMWLTTYGGKLAENATQAVSRDVMACAMPRIDPHYPIVGTVHDEILTETPDDPRYTVEGLTQLMVEAPDWAEGLPIAADGYEARRYRK